MKMRIQTLLTKLTLACLALASAQAAWADDPNVEIMKKLYTKIGQVVGVGSNDPVVGSSFLVLANPGILIDPTIDMSTMQGRHALAASIDKILLPKWIYGATNDTTLNLYQTVLTYKEPPLYTLTDQEKQMLADARSIIFKDVRNRVYSDEYKDYTSTKAALASAIGDVGTYSRANPNQSIPPTLLNSLQDARDAYNLIGQKNKFIGAMATIQTYEALDPFVWWGNLQNQFDFNTEIFNNTPSAKFDLYPSYSNWLDSTRTWTPFTISQQDLERTTSSSQSSVGGGLSAGFGLWSVGADYSHQEQRTYFQLDLSGYSISMELLRVTIDRPWMTSTVFHSHAWKWLASGPYGPKALISDGGDAAHGVSPQGLMPFLPTGLLIARKVSMTGTFSHDLTTTFNSQTSGGASIGWGPFSFGGRTNSSQQNTYTKATAAGNSLEFDTPQILGFFVEVLPKVPDVDPSLKFASDQPQGPSPTPRGHDYSATTIGETVVISESGMLQRHSSELLKSGLDESEMLLKSSASLLESQRK